MDIALRLNKDILVLSGAVDAGLKRLGVDVEHDLAIANILEPDTIKNAISPYVLGGAQCLIANTKHILQAKLAHENLDNRIEEIAKSSIDIAKSCNPEHIVVELGNCGLPLDDESKFSLNEFKNQYVNSARIFEKFDFDAYYLSGFESNVQIKCALMGLRQASDKPIIVCVEVDSEGKLNSKEDIYDYASILVDFGATIAGIKTNEDINTASRLCKRLRAGCDLPALLEFVVDEDKHSPYCLPESMKEAAIAGNMAGAQFLRVSGEARPAHTAVLAGTAGQLSLNIKIGV